MISSRKLILIILSGILVRLLLMPFFAHQDLFSTYRRAEQIAFGSGSLLKTTDPLAHFIEATWLRLVAIATGSEFFSAVHQDLPDIEQINSFSFIFKTPYLLAELAFWILVARFFNLSTKRWLFLVFNPIILYSLYMFGRYESFVMVLTTVMLVLLQKNKLADALTVLGALIFSRFSMFLILPGVLMLKIKAKFKWILAISLVMAFALFVVLNNYQAGGLWNWLLYGQHTGYLTATRLDLPFGVYLPLFPVAVIGALMILKRRFSRTPELNNAERFAYTALIILLLYYSLAFFHPHYFLWLMPFWLYLSPNINRKVFWLVSLLSIPLYFLFTLHWRGATTLQLFVPIADFFGYFEFSGESQANLLYKIAAAAKLALSALLLGAAGKISLDIGKKPHE